MNFHPLLLQAVESTQQITEVSTSIFDWKDPIFLTAIAALITAIAAIFAPVLTALMTYWGERKLRITDLFFHAKTDAYTKLLSITSHHLISKMSANDAHDLIDVAATAMLYSSDDTRNIIRKYCSILNSKEANKYEQFRKIQQELIAAMQKELSELTHR